MRLGFGELAICATALGSGLVAGVFFAFSTFVMTGLDRLPTAQAIAAMQSINRAAVTPPFMAALFGTAAACIGLAVWVALTSGDARAAWVLVWAATYITGVVVVTIAANVPLNDQLAHLSPQAHPEAWAGYVRDWSAWNHVRTLSGLVTTGLLLAGLVVR